MITLTINDMTCGGCVASISRVVKNLDAAATVTADVAAKRVTVETNKDASTVIAAISEAGFHPVMA